MRSGTIVYLGNTPARVISVHGRNILCSELWGRHMFLAHVEDLEIAKGYNTKVMEYVLKHGRHETLHQIAEKVGVSRITVFRALKAGKRELV